MTKKKRELIEILLDNVKPEDWPENLPFAAQDKVSTSTGVSTIWIYQEKPVLSKFNLCGWNSVAPSKYDDFRVDVELCKHWNKTIVHRDEFMKRWNERNPAVDSEGWIQWNGGEMPVEKGTLIDVKYRDGKVNLHVEAGGEFPSKGSIPSMTANRWSKRNAGSDIIAYRLHEPQKQKTPQQLALEKFGTDWHDNEGVQPVDGEILIEVMFNHGAECLEPIKAKNWSFSCEDGLGEKERSFTIMKWRIHSDEKESQIDDGAEEMSAGGYTDRGNIEMAFKPESGIEKVILDRGINYGRFEDGAEIMQQLKRIAHTSQGWERMKPIQREGMDMILHKIGRILNGDPAYVDSWIDIEGYSKLVSDWLKGESK